MKKTEWKKMLKLRNLKFSNSYAWEIEKWTKSINERSNPVRIEEAHAELKKFEELAEKEKQEFEKSQKELENLKNALNSELQACQGKAKERCVDVYDVLSAFDQLTEYWGRIAPKKTLKGVEVTVNPFAKSFSSSYRFQPQTTFVKFVHDGTNFIFVGAIRGTADRAGRDRVDYFNISEDLKMAIIEKTLQISL